MGYFIITDSNWAKLRNKILFLAETCHISKRTLQHYRDTGVLPFSQIGHKCYYKCEDVERLLQTKIKKSKAEKNKFNK